MSRAALLVVLALLLAVIVAAVAEWTSRVRTGLASLRRSSALRTLDADEHAALATVRALTGCVHDDQVQVLRGKFTGGSASRHYPVGDGLLGGIPVLLPRQACPHLAADNDAEVVLGERWAVVVRLNGFHVAAMRPVAAASRIRGERLETPEEVAMRRGPGLRPSALLIAVLALWAAADASGLLCLSLPRDVSYLSGVPLFAIAGLGFWLGRPRRRGPATAQRVLQVQGRLRAYQRNGQTSQAWLLGKDLRVQLPWEWVNVAGFSTGRSMRLDVRACDGKVLAAGPGWCLASDRLSYPASGGFWHLAWLGLLLLLQVLGVIWLPLPQRPDLGWPGVLHWQLFALLAAGWHVLMLVVCVRRSVSRTAALGAALKARPAPGTE
ncbi:MAG: hypothetical protein K0R79_2076 [Stenotrophomonas indicatrix]|jgi:hypothetical protein|uniref:hypothetical protein n=1 Tax=Stenotrophomonas indicatrix TaxID=2045451 RepID=UPI002430B32F|nr:hypothetical protein [Stenotrophomonas indicatrix]MDF2481719.1 hypothetical protein [Stenotrophomonas indicatrix]